MYNPITSTRLYTGKVAPASLSFQSYLNIFIDSSCSPLLCVSRLPRWCPRHTVSVDWVLPHLLSIGEGLGKVWIFLSSMRLLPSVSLMSRVLGIIFYFLSCSWIPLVSGTTCSGSILSAYCPRGQIFLFVTIAGTIIHFYGWAHPVLSHYLSEKAVFQFYRFLEWTQTLAPQVLVSQLERITEPVGKKVGV